MLGKPKTEQFILTLPRNPLLDSGLRRNGIFEKFRNYSEKPIDFRTHDYLSYISQNQCFLVGLSSLATLVERDLEGEQLS
jgi:hypothetical protein